MQDWARIALDQSPLTLIALVAVVLAIVGAMYSSLRFAARSKDQLPNAQVADRVSRAIEEGADGVRRSVEMANDATRRVTAASAERLSSAAAMLEAAARQSGGADKSERIETELARRVASEARRSSARSEREAERIRRNSEREMQHMRRMVQSEIRSALAQGGKGRLAHDIAFLMLGAALGYLVNQLPPIVQFAR